VQTDSIVKQNFRQL